MKTSNDSITNKKQNFASTAAQSVSKSIIAEHYLQQGNSNEKQENNSEETDEYDDFGFCETLF